MLSCPSKPACGVSLRLFALMVVASAAGAAAQCATQWLPGQGVRGTNGVVHATTLWDPDGAGPMHPVLVVGGEFTIAGGVVANGIAILDPVSGTWSALGSGMSVGTYLGVFALATLPNGDLVASGRFPDAGGVSVNNIARWNGTSWSGLGSGFSPSSARCWPRCRTGISWRAVWATSSGGMAPAGRRWDRWGTPLAVCKP